LFRRLYELHPHTVRGVDTFSTVLWQLKDEKTLNQLSRRAVFLAPSRAETWIASGNLFSLQHNTDAAIQMFQRAATIDKSSSYSLALAGHELLLFDSLADAAKLFRQAIDRNPGEWSAWYGIGSVHFRQDNFNAAEYYMKRALDLNPSSSVLFYVYAMVLRKCGRDDEAQVMFDRALEVDPMNLVAAYQKAVLLHEIGDISGAVECLKKAASLVPHEPGVALLRGKIAQSLGHLEEATSWYTDALIYGHPEKKEILWSVERMSEALTRAVLEEDE
jgi:anaphase-promoting complex subunit 3